MKYKDEGIIKALNAYKRQVQGNIYDGFTVCEDLYRFREKEVIPSVLKMYLFFIGMFIWKHFFMRIDLGSLKTSFALLTIICFVPFVQFALPWDFTQYCDEYKEDYKAYQNGECETIELELYDIGEAAKGSCFDNASEITEHYDMDIKNVRCTDYKYFGETLHLINNDIGIYEGSIYKVKYLKNSGIIVEIQEVK